MPNVHFEMFFFLSYYQLSVRPGLFGNPPNSRLASLLLCNKVAVSLLLLLQSLVGPLDGVMLLLWHFEVSNCSWEHCEGETWTKSLPALILGQLPPSDRWTWKNLTLPLIWKEPQGTMLLFWQYCSVFVHHVCSLCFYDPQILCCLHI